MTDIVITHALRTAVGKFGGSIAKDLRRTGFASEILGVEQSPSHAQLAVDLGLVDKVVSRQEAAAGSDLIILTVPVNALIDELTFVLESIGPDTVVTDLGSTKGIIIDGIKAAPNRNRYVASHPMAGRERSGPFVAQQCAITSRTYELSIRE